MSPELSEIKGQPISTLIGAYMECKTCYVVDRDMDRMTHGHVCGTCSTPGTGGRLLYPWSVTALLDMMQEAFHSALPENRWYDFNQREVSVVLFFCTLREVLLNFLLERICLAQQLPEPIINRMFRDNQTYMQRLNNLLPTLTGKKWTLILEEETAAANLDYVALGRHMELAAKRRNAFMHEGAKGLIDRGLAEECINQSHALMDLYAGLHNRFAFHARWVQQGAAKNA
jgi:hypothetical protein